MGGKVKKQGVYRNPNSNRSIMPTPVPISRPPTIPVPAHNTMEIDDIGTRQDKRNPFPAILSTCIQKGLCFRFLRPFEPKTHIIDGERRCPKKNASLADKLALVSKDTDKKKPFETKTHQIAALKVGSDTEEQDELALAKLQ